MNACTHRYLDDPDGVPCTRQEHPENPGGHTYAGVSVPDGHDTSEAAAEASR